MTGEHTNERYTEAMIEAAREFSTQRDDHQDAAVKMGVLYVTEKIDEATDKLTVRVDTLIKGAEDLLAERDRRMVEGFTERDVRYEQRFVAQESALTAARQTNDAALSAALVAVQNLSDERDRRISDTLAQRDHRYEQRFIAQESALGLALNRVDKEFHEHIQSVRGETRAALDAADKAITKSEISTEKRFEAANGYREQLADQAAKFMPRNEAEQRITTNAEKIDSNDQRLRSEITANDARYREDIRIVREQLASTAGKSSGADKLWGYVVGGVGLVATVLTIIITTRPG